MIFLPDDEGVEDPDPDPTAFFNWSLRGWVIASAKFHAMMWIDIDIYNCKCFSNELIKKVNWNWYENFNKLAIEFNLV